MTQVQRKLPAPTEANQLIHSLTQRFKAAWALVNAYPPQLRQAHKPTLIEMSMDFTAIKTGLHSADADHRELLARLCVLGTKLGKFQDRLQGNPPTHSLLTPLTDELSALPELDSLLQAAHAISNAPTVQAADELNAHYDSLLTAFTDAVNTHFKEGWMAYILNYAGEGLFTKGFQFGLNPAKREGCAQKIILWKKDENGFQEQDVGKLLQPTGETPENKSFSLTLHSAQLTDNPLGWLEGYCKLQGLLLRNLSGELEQQAISKGMQSFSATFGREGIIMRLEVIFTDSSKMNLKLPE